MTFRAILDDGLEHRPVLKLLSGEMTPRQVDSEYLGAVGKCPDCEKLLLNTDIGLGGTWAAAIQGKDRSVSYRRGVYQGGTDLLLSQMHFKHVAGYLQNGTSPCNCKTRNQLIHAEAVEAIANQYRKDMPKGFKVDSECQFVKPGTPPEKYRPDIVVFNQYGGKHTCIEYQRSPEKFESFVHRHELRGSEWGSVIWFFDEKIWQRKSTCEARDWLFDNNQTFYRCWVDENSLQLQVEVGSFATAVVSRPDRSRLRKFAPRACSTADIVSEYLLATGQEVVGNTLRIRKLPEPLKIDRLMGFNLVEKSKIDSQKNRKLFEILKRQKEEREEEERLQRLQANKWLIVEATKESTAKAPRRLIINNPKHSIKVKRVSNDGKPQEKDFWVDVENIRPAKNQPVKFEVSKKQLKREAEELHAKKIYAQQEKIRKEKEDCRMEIIRKNLEERKRIEEEMLQLYLEKERQRQIERKKVEEERLRLYQEEEAKWVDLEFSDTTYIRGQAIKFVLNLRVDDLIRRGSGHLAEVYLGRCESGYQTEGGTYSSLEGWQKRNEA